MVIPGGYTVKTDLSLENSFTLCGSGSLDIKTISLDTVGITKIKTISLKTITVFFYFHCHQSFSIILSQGYHFQSFSCPWQSLCFIFSVSLRQLCTAKCCRNSCPLSVPRKSLQMLWDCWQVSVFWAVVDSVFSILNKGEGNCLI